MQRNFFVKQEIDKNEILGPKKKLEREKLIYSHKLVLSFPRKNKLLLNVNVVEIAIEINVLSNRTLFIVVIREMMNIHFFRLLRQGKMG
jgi:hypothetical protein